jgi:rRNA maturation RNase YbeY
VAIRFFTEDCAYSLPHKQLINKWLKIVIETLGFKVGDINYIFCSDNEILKINNQYLGHNYFTDIITFPYLDNKLVSSDIYISIDTVKANSEKFKQSFTSELNRVMVHGVLHLIGFDDKSKIDKVKMREEENRCLDLLKTIHY